jgi:predicted RNA-binding protein YlqC (UPF0109 family)
VTDVDDAADDSAASGQELDDDEANQAVAPTAVAVMTYLARSVVEDTDAVRVEVQRLRGKRVRISVFAAPNDFGRLIGRRGRVAAALRTVVGAAAAKDGCDAEVEFVE